MRQIAPAPLGQRRAFAHAHFLFLMEQPPQYIGQRQGGIGQFVGAQRVGQHLHMLPFGMIVTHMQPFPPDFAFGQMLEQQAGGDAPFARVMAGGDADQAGDLFGLEEIMLRRIGQ